MNIKLKTYIMNRKLLSIVIASWTGICISNAQINIGDRALGAIGNQNGY